MFTDVCEADGSQPAEQVTQPLMEFVTPMEWQLLKYYRRLSEADQRHINRAILALATCLPSD